MNSELKPELNWQYGYALALALGTISATCAVVIRRFKRAGSS
jgi:Mg2+ and Co2+ transporter CorA